MERGIADKGWPKNLSLKIRSSLLGHLLSMQRGVTRNGHCMQFEDKRWASQYRRSQFPEGHVYVEQHGGGITTFAARALSAIGFYFVIPMG